MDRKTIFLVDDDITNLEIGNKTLSEKYDVFTLNSCTRLMKMLEKCVPDLILLDVEMPETNGYETIKLIRQNEKAKNIPVIFLTAQSDGESELEGLSLGAIDYIIKPFSPPLLLKRIEVHLLVESQKQELINFNKNLQEMVEARTRTVVELKDAYLKTMAELVEFRDYVTGGHIERTQYYLSILLGALQRCGLYTEETKSWETDLIIHSAQLHDIGKIAIRDNVLQKPGRLTQPEFEEIKTHVPAGVKVIEKIKMNTTEHGFLEQAKILVATHHEKWDGSGYPGGLRGSEIPLQGRLMAIADVYDALVADRPYRKAIMHNEAVNIIYASRGKHFDPALVDIFLGVSEKFNDFTVFNNSKYAVSAGGKIRELAS
ncbi:MAG: response regulator [Treponema sp.]|nr:response regulator [Treponema sp.]